MAEAKIRSVQTGEQPEMPGTDPEATETENYTSMPRGHVVNSPPPGMVTEQYAPSANAAYVATEPTETAIPGVYVDATKVVVLASRLGRKQVPMPKIDPNDATEPTKYYTPEAFERGQIIDVSEIPDIPGINNVARLKRIGAIGSLDHPDAQPAIAGYNYRIAQESRVMAERGIIGGPVHQAQGHI